MSLTFRPIDKSDKAIINHMMRAGKQYWGYPEERLDVFMEKFSIQDDAYFDNAFGYTAEENNKLIGFYIFVINEDDIELEHFILGTTFIGKGYGRKLWNHCIEQVQVNGLKEFMFWAEPNARPFYEHMGAIKTGDRDMVTMPGIKAPIMKYVL